MTHHLHRLPSPLHVGLGLATAFILTAGNSQAQVPAPTAPSSTAPVVTPPAPDLPMAPSPQPNPIGSSNPVAQPDASSVSRPWSAVQAAPGQAPWTSSPPPGCQNLPWVWGVPPPGNGPVWYLAPGAPTFEGFAAEKPEEPKKPVGRRTSLKRALTITGAVGFGLSGLGAGLAYSSALDKYGLGSGWETLFIPVVGPFIAAGAAEGVSKNGQVPFLVAGGVVECAFVGLLAAGVFLKGDPPPEPEKKTAQSWMVTPVVSPNGAGVQIGGSL
ncbi:MAG: hypothetical protein IPK82_04865 [Polyangiaceae bacterium]|nr:hypothetical protein [Polyangiaceae bacterium]